jgi:hypothetical protein
MLDASPPSFLRDFSMRVRQMVAAARTEAARDQLAMWAEECEQRAESLEKEIAARAVRETSADSG